MQKSVDNKKLIVLIAIAYFFSLSVRYYWVHWASGIDDFIWHGQVMINNVDGYYFASGAQKALFGMHMHNPRVPNIWDSGTTFFTVFASKFFKIPLDTVILYMPAVVSSLVVIPIILLFKLYGKPILGFFAALLGSITWSYYNRTMAGYYDTDMFSAMAPMFILYFLIATIEKRDFKNLLWASFFIIIYPFLYDQGLSIIYAIGIIYMLYMLIFHRYERFTYQSITIVAISLLPINMGDVLSSCIVKMLIVGGVYFLFKKDILKENQEKIFSALLVLLFLIMGNVFGLIWHKVAEYAIRGTESKGLHFFQVNQTVREAGHIPFDLLAKRISGSVIGFIAAIIGYIFLVIKYRPFILALPLFGIGLFAYIGGLRFTVYAVSVAAISLVYLAYLVVSFLKEEKFRLTATGILTALALWPNITHIIGYKVPTTFNKHEVKVLDNLSKIGDDKDYVLTWWDYGYPIWYYANKNTLVDGGKHGHDDFIASEILTTSSQIEAARLSRIAVETYVQSGYKVVADTLFKNNTSNQIDPNEYLEKLKNGNNIKLPKKTRDIYFFLPYRMMNIFPTVAIFSSIDLNTGHKIKNNFFYKSNSFANRGDFILLGRGIQIDKKNGLIYLGNRKIPIKRFSVSFLTKDGKTISKTQIVHQNGYLNVIFMKSYHAILVLDDNMFNSFYIQLFALGNYDKNLFELVESNPWAKVYKLKL